MVTATRALFRAENTMRCISPGAPGLSRDEFPIVAERRVGVWDSELADMANDKYPRVTFRLSAELLRRLKLLAMARNRSVGQVLRESIQMYWAAHDPVLRRKSDSNT
mgnify:CR=1 FL=1